ncbi:Ig-like domain-containing protein [Secundilactobacillus kimchicus]|uniref:Ig-like domain-containing protein n=1 Tax=Secundilactobacillus kimchicus TaxID=528209 RepID=UPI0006E123D4|nr:Ig-like domain-containing protein [Secundilactobacillus kimchicus]
MTGVTMSQATATGDIGKTVVLTATVAPETATDKTVVWASSDDKIATVKDGTVTFVAAGTADITATVGGKSATTKVTVKTPVVAVTKITLDPATASVEAGKTVALTAKVEPDNATDKTVAWTSSDDKIATVKDGTVTGVVAGEATITGTSADGKVTGTATVTVTAPAAG